MSVLTLQATCILDDMFLDILTSDDWSVVSGIGCPEERNYANRM